MCQMYEITKVIERIMFNVPNNFVVLTLLSPLIISSSLAQQLERQMIESYLACSADNDCNPNSFCFGNDHQVSGRCKCKENYFMTFRNTTYYECSTGIKLQEPCQQDIECQIIATDLAECNKYKLCDCKSEAHVYEGKCFLTTKIGDLCMSDGNCYISNSSRAFCTNGRCECRLDQRPSEDRTRCIKATKLGDPCSLDEECTSLTPNSRCTEHCTCAAIYTLSRDDSTCVKAAAKFGEPCDFDGQCSHYLTESICDKGNCTCSEGLHEYGDRCVRSKKTGEMCTEDAECIYERKLNGNVKCEGYRCACLFGSTGDGDCVIEKIDDSSSSTRWMASIYFTVLTYISHYSFLRFL